MTELNFDPVIEANFDRSENELKGYIYRCKHPGCDFRVSVTKPGAESLSLAAYLTAHATYHEAERL